METDLLINEFFPLKNLLPPENLRPFIGSRAGLVKQIIQNGIEPDEAHLFHLSVVTSNASILLQQPSLDIRAAGSGSTYREAFGCAVGEVVERSALASYDKKAIVRGSYRELSQRGVEVLSPEQLDLFSKEQYTNSDFLFEPFTDTAELGWTEGVNLLTGKPVLVPAQAVLMSYKPFPGEAFITYSTTSGCACATSMESAIIKCVYEQVERDAVMLTWLTKTSPPGVDAEKIVSAALLKKLNMQNNSATDVYDLRYLSYGIDIPVFLGILQRKIAGKKRLLIGAAANLCAQAASEKALLETAQSIPFLKLILASNPNPDFAGISFNDFEKNLRYYADERNQHHLTFLQENNDVFATEKLPDHKSRTTEENLTFILKTLKRNNLTPIAIDHGNAEYRDLGFHVLRVFIPELLQLYTPNAPFLGNRRMHSVLGKLGKQETVNDLNLLPHPMP
ncbi:MAG: YcaO-like family protein [Calditrichia bacterium]